MNPYAFKCLTVYNKIFHHVFGYLCVDEDYICLKILCRGANCPINICWSHGWGVDLYFIYIFVINLCYYLICICYTGQLSLNK
jgi:hypothetical protein